MIQARTTEGAISFSSPNHLLPMEPKALENRLGCGGPCHAVTYAVLNSMRRDNKPIGIGASPHTKTVQQRPR